MEISESVDLLAALASPTRLQLFRRLIAEGPDGVAAGGLAASLDVPPSTLSVHLARLEGAGLIASRRVGRNIYYSVRIERVRALISFLVDDCCQGRPDLCGDIVAKEAA